MIIDTEGKIVKQIIGADSIEEYVRTLLEWCWHKIIENLYLNLICYEGN